MMEIIFVRDAEGLKAHIEPSPGGVNIGFGCALHINYNISLSNAMPCLRHFSNQWHGFIRRGVRSNIVAQFLPQKKIKLKRLLNLLSDGPFRYNTFLITHQKSHPTTTTIIHNFDTYLFLCGKTIPHQNTHCFIYISSS